MSRKGITPVIAVVLLLLITVGAVASAWGLYQQITSNQGQLNKLNAQKRASNTDISFTSAVNETGTPGNPGDNHSTTIYIQNTGSRAINLGKELEVLYSPDGEQGYVSYQVLNNSYSDWAQDYNTGCFQFNNVTLSKGSTYSCDTGAKFPSATQTLGIKINYKNADNTEWTYQCTPQTSGTSTC